MEDPPGAYLSLESPEHRLMRTRMHHYQQQHHHQRSTGLDTAPPPAFASMSAAQYSAQHHQDSNDSTKNTAGSHETEETAEESISDDSGAAAGDGSAAEESPASKEQQQQQQQQKQERSAKEEVTNSINNNNNNNNQEEKEAVSHHPAIDEFKAQCAATQTLFGEIIPEGENESSGEEPSAIEQQSVEEVGSKHSADDDLVSYIRDQQKVNSNIRLPLVPAEHSTSLDTAAGRETTTTTSGGDKPVSPVSPSRVEDFYMEEEEDEAAGEEVEVSYASSTSAHCRRINDLARFAAQSGQPMETIPPPSPPPSPPASHEGQYAVSPYSDDSVLTDDFLNEMGENSSREPLIHAVRHASDDSVLTDELYLDRRRYYNNNEESNNNNGARAESSRSYDDSVLDDFYSNNNSKRFRDHGASWDETVLSQDLYVEDNSRLRNGPGNNNNYQAGAHRSASWHEPHQGRRRDDQPQRDRTLVGPAAALREEMDEFTLELRDMEQQNDDARRHTISVMNNNRSNSQFLTRVASAQAQRAPLSLVGYNDDATIASRDGLTWLYAGDDDDGDNVEGGGLPGAGDETNESQQTGVSALRQQGFPSGLAYGTKKIPLRFYIVCNARSMNTPDALQVLFDCRVKPSAQSTGPDSSSHHDYTSIIPTRRWGALQGSMTDHIRLAGTIQVATVFRMSNDPGLYVGPQELSIGNLASFLYLDTERDECDTERFASDVEQAIGAIHRTQPRGAQRPLTSHLLEFRDRIRSVEDQLRRQGQQAAIIVTTDGLPTDQLGEDTVAAREEFNETLRSLQYLPVRIIIRLCTDKARVAEYYRYFEQMPDLPLVVVNDFLEEAKLVHAQNPWLNYAIPLHRYREMGCHRKVFDKLNRKPLSKGELVDFLYLLFGEDAMLNAPDISTNWKRFCSFVSRINSAEGKHWRPHTQKCEYWIDMDQLQLVYGKRSKRFWLFPFCGRRERRRTGPASL